MCFNFFSNIFNAYFNPVFTLSDNPENNVCEERTFEKLFLEHSKSIFHFIYYKCGNEARSHDIVQESYTRLWENCAKVPFKNARAFLYRVANNLFLNEVKAQKVVLKYAPKSNPVTHVSPEYVLEEKEYEKKLQAAIGNLTEAQRTAFLLNRIDGKKYSEIAEMLNISVKAVEKRIHGALVNLRKEIEGI